MPVHSNAHCADTDFIHLHEIKPRNLNISALPSPSSLLSEKPSKRQYIEPRPWPDRWATAARPDRHSWPRHVAPLACFAQEKLLAWLRARALGCRLRDVICDTMVPAPIINVGKKTYQFLHSTSNWSRSSNEAYNKKRRTERQK